MTAKYLVRIDDICPTMNWAVWKEVEIVLTRWGIKPLLAVVPDNQDDVLKVNPPDAPFWDRVRAWRDRGWTIALHGYQHKYVTQNPGIMGICKYSEFAGLPHEVQAVKLQRAFEIFRREGIRPDAWIAPGHSFDRTTVDLLREMGLRRISDGFFLFPSLDSTGTLWIPAQLWRFRRMPLGMWTVCLHINAWGADDILQFQRDVERYRENIISLEDAITRYGDRRRDWRDKLLEMAYPAFLRTRSTLRFGLTRIAPRALAFARARRARRLRPIAPKTHST